MCGVSYDDSMKAYSVEARATNGHVYRGLLSGRGNLLKLNHVSNGQIGLLAQVDVDTGPPIFGSRSPNGRSMRCGRISAMSGTPIMPTGRRSSRSIRTAAPSICRCTDRGAARDSILKVQYQVYWTKHDPAEDVHIAWIRDAYRATFAETGAFPWRTARSRTAATSGERA